MSIELALLAFVAFAALYSVAIKTHIAYSILALSAGYLLSSFLADDLASLFSVGDYRNYLSIFLLLLPMIIISTHFKKTQLGFKRLVSQLVPGLAFALLLTLLVFNELPRSVADNIIDQSYIMRNILAFDSLMVAFAFLVAFFDIIVGHDN